MALPKSKRSDENPRKNDLGGHDKVKLLKTVGSSLNYDVSSQGKNSTLPLAGKAKAWASTYLTPLMDCLKDHVGSDPKKFMAAHPVNHPTTLPAKYCNGNGTQCSH